MSYYKKRIQVRGYTRHKPRTKIVKAYFRKQRFKKITPKPIKKIIKKPLTVFERDKKSIISHLEKKGYLITKISKHSTYETIHFEDKAPHLYGRDYYHSKGSIRIFYYDEGKFELSKPTPIDAPIYDYVGRFIRKIEKEPYKSISAEKLAKELTTNFVGALIPTSKWVTMPKEWIDPTKIIKKEPKPKKIEPINADKWIKQNILTEKQWGEFMYGEKTYLTYLNENISKLFKERQKAKTEEERNKIFEREKIVSKIRDDYGHKLFEEQQKKIREKEEKERKGRNLLLKRRFEFFKDYEINDEKPISDISKKFYGVMNMNRTAIMYPSSKIKDSPFHEKTLEKKTNINIPPKKFIISGGGEKWIQNPHTKEQYFDLDKIKHFADKLDKQFLKVYHGKDSPLVIKDKNLTFALSPRIAQFHEIDIEVTSERYDNLKKMTKKQLYDVTGVTKKGLNKDALIFEYLRIEKGL